MKNSKENAPNSSGNHRLITLAALIIVAAGIKAAEQLIVPFVLSIFIAIIAATPVFWLNRFRIPVAAAIGFVVIAMVCVLLGVGALVTEAVNDFSLLRPQYEVRLRELSTSLFHVLKPLNISTEHMNSLFDPAQALQLAGTTLQGIGTVLSNSFLILLTVIFILAEASSFPRKLQEVLDHPSSSIPHFFRFAENVNRYIAIKTSASVVTGVLVSTMLWLFGVDFPILWGVLAFMLNYVPTIGSIIAAIPALLLTLIQLGPTATLGVAGSYALINVIMGNVVEPRYMGKGLGLSTLVVFLSLVFWGWMLGPVGMLLSVPLTISAKIAMEANPNSIWIAHLLGPAIDSEAMLDNSTNEATDE